MHGRRLDERHAAAKGRGGVVTLAWKKIAKVIDPFSYSQTKAIAPDHKGRCPMQRLRFRLRTYLAATIVLAAILVQPLAARSASAQAPGQFVRPQFYLAMGDSISYGYQQRIINDWEARTGALPPSSAFNLNAVSLFATLLRTVNPRLQTANYACPGATTSTIIQDNGCTTSPYALHDAYTTSQLTAAVQYVKDRGTGVITVDAGANDLIALLTSCGNGFTPSDLACLNVGAPAVITTIGNNMGTILGTLRHYSPTSTIIVLQLYNPYAVIAPDAAPLILALNQGLAAAAAATGAKLANAYGPFNTRQPQPQVLCALSNICGPLADIHPTYAGYAVIARLFTTAYVSSFFDQAAIPAQLTANSTS
jgi:lysophospholipase L1-like esterase